MTMMILLLLVASSFLLLFGVGVDAFVIHIDPNSQSWVTGMAVLTTGGSYDENNEDDVMNNVLITGTTFYNDNGNSNCFVSSGDPLSEHSSETYTLRVNHNFETPQICMSTPLWLPVSVSNAWQDDSNDEDDTSNNNNNVRMAVMFGLDDDDSLVNTIQIIDDHDDNDDNDDDNDNRVTIKQTAPYPLLQNTIPVASITPVSSKSPTSLPEGENVGSIEDRISDVIVALQDADGIKFSGEQQQNNNLQSLLTFLEVTNSDVGNRNNDEVDDGSSSSQNNIDVQIIRINSITGIPVFHTGFEMDTGTVTINAMCTVGSSYLAVVGATTGSGNAVGTPMKENSTDDTCDGYVTYLDIHTGAVLNDKPPLRVHSRPVHDICYYEYNHGGLGGRNGNNTHIERYLFIVGTGDGVVESIHNGAFVWKIDGVSGDVIWKRQIAGSAVEGLACAISYHDDENEVQIPVLYIGGTTQIDLQTNNVPTKSVDMFVHALSVDTGDDLWTKQIDTTSIWPLPSPEGRGDDAVAETTTTAAAAAAATITDVRDDILVQLSVGSNGNVYALWNSMNLESGMNDAYLMDFDKGTGDNDLSSGRVRLIPGESLGKKAAQDNDSTMILVAILVPISLATIVFGYTWYSHRTDVERISRTKGDTEPRQLDPDATTGVV